MNKVHFGYNDILKIGDDVLVIRTGHKAKISEVIGKPRILHCTCYKITPKDPNDLGGHWYFRHGIELILNAN